jgi:hypothetical protein
MKNIIAIASLIIATFISSQAHALFEARLAYGLLMSKPNLDNLYNGASTVPGVAPTYGLGGDVLISLPLIPIGFGIRSENMGLKVSEGSLEFEAKNQRTALLLNYRLIDTLMFVGPTFTYGLSHSASIGVSEGGNKISEFTSSKVSSSSIGLEAGVKLIGFSVGAEVGTENLMMKGAKDSKGLVGDQDINLSGSYAKVLLGFGI